MDVIFWNGGIAWPTLSRYVGPYKIAHWLRKHGHTARVIDFVTIWHEHDLYKLTKKFITKDTKILALSTTFVSNSTFTWSDGSIRRLPEHVVNVAKQLKSEYPNLKFILGGYLSDKIDGAGVVDATVMSYVTATEDIFLEYLNHLKSGTQLPIGELIFPGIGTEKNKQHRMIYNVARNPTYNIEQDDFRFTKEDCILPGEPLPLDISKGCIFACKFCQFPHLGKSKLDYIRGMEYIEQELRYNYENFGSTIYYLLDDTFNDTEIKIQAFYDMTQRLPFKITYVAYLRADLIERFPNMSYLLQESGLFGAYHGLESLHPEASKLIGKAWSGKRAREYIPELYHNIWKKEIPMHTNFIVGFPGDTEESVNSTLDWFVQNNLHSIKFNSLGLYGPNTDKTRFSIQSEFDKNAEKYGFEFTSEETSEGVRYWKNKNWTSGRAVELSEKLDKKALSHNRNLTWLNPSLLWYGYTKDDINKMRRLDVNWQDMRAKSKILYNKYFQMVLNSNSEVPEFEFRFMK